MYNYLIYVHCHQRYKYILLCVKFQILLKDFFFIIIIYSKHVEDSWQLSNLTPKFFSMYLFIYSSLHVSSMSCSSSGETNCINTASGNCHSVLVAVSCAGWECVKLDNYKDSCRGLEHHMDKDR